MNDVWDILSLVGNLALIILVLVLTYVFTRWYARRMGGGTAGGKHIRIVERTPMGTGTSLVIARVGETYYLLAVGDKNVTLLTELPEDFGQTLAEEPPAAPATFQQILRQFTDKSRDTLKKKDDGGRNDGE